MAPRLVAFSGAGGWAEASAFESERLKKPRAEEVFEWEVGDAFEHGSGDCVAGVAVFPVAAGFVSGCVSECSGGEFIPLVAWFADALERAVPDVFGRFVWSACAVGEELLKSDVVPIGVHLSDEFGEDVSDGGMPLDAAVFNEHGGDCGSHAFCAGADDPEIVQSDGFLPFYAALTGGTHGDEFAFIHGGGGESGDAVFDANALDFFGDILRLGVDASGNYQ
jgi:hypothetical protein